jgi:hypothetical protein
MDKTVNILENISQELKRRITVYDFDEELKNILEYEINSYLYNRPVDFIEDVCDNLVNNLIDSISNYTPTPKEKDELYYYFVSQYSDKIHKEFKKAHNNKRQTNESVKKIIVTESQYKRLFEQKKSKIEVFQDLINDKLEYIRGFCSEDLSAENYGGDVGFGSCDDLAVIDSIKVDEVNMMTSARTDMSGNLYDSTPSIYIKLTIDYTDIGNYSNFDDIVYDLKHILKKSTGGLPIIFDYRTKNLNKNKEW